MSTQSVETQSDVWSDWLLRDRHGGDAQHRKTISAQVGCYIDRVLDAARLTGGMTLADIGTGDGAVAFRAIERVGPSLCVLLADISKPLLKYAETIATQVGLTGQCTFIQNAADSLDGIDDLSVDVVTTRAVLAYVENKRAALCEFHRILKPGGRLSIAEPILQDEALDAIALGRWLASRTTSSDEVTPLLLRWKAAQLPNTLDKLANSPLTNYSERDLLEMVRDSGFVDIHLELHIDVQQIAPVTWNTFVDTAPHPLAPTLRWILENQFSTCEQHLFETTLRPMVEEGTGVSTERVVYLSATKPTSGKKWHAFASVVS